MCAEQELLEMCAEQELLEMCAEQELDLWNILCWKKYVCKL